MYLGLDVGGTKIQGACLHAGRVVMYEKVATPLTGYADFLEALEEIGRKAAQETGSIDKIGIGIPGTVVRDCITWVPNLPFLDGKPLAADLQARLGAPVQIANDAQLALLGEVWQGAAQNRQSAVLLSIGTGVGGAILLDGKVVVGEHGGAGAFGWLNLDWREATDPQHGYVERHLSGTALAELGSRFQPPVTSYEIITRAREADPLCQVIVQRFGRLLGLACASIASILDPEAVLLAGGLADAFDVFAEPLRAALREAGAPGIRALPVLVAALGPQAAAYGAIRAAMLEPEQWRSGAK